MDNQQEIFDKGYLLGILDGEGTVHLSIGRYKSQKGYKGATILKPRVNVVANTNAWIVQKIVNILNRHNLPHWVRETQRTKANKRFYVVMIEGMKRVPKFIEWVGGTEFAKKKQLGVLEDFIKLRQRDSGRPRGKNGYPLYTDEEWSLWQKCKDLNQRVPQRLHVTHPTG